jgi:DNA helicase-2/ATP-dependent DNA helicase PcrA
MDELSLRARDKRLSMLSVVEKICDNRIPDIKPPVKRKLGGFVKAMQNLKKSASEVNFRGK